MLVAENEAIVSLSISERLHEMTLYVYFKKKIGHDPVTVVVTASYAQESCAI